MLQWILNLFAKIFTSTTPPKPEPVESPVPTLPSGNAPVEPPKVVPAPTLSLKAYAKAKTQLGVAETDGDDNNPMIVEYDKATDLPKDMWGDDVAWCSAFHNWCFQQVGGKGTHDAMARSWLDWGTKVTTPREGDTVIFSSPSRGSSSGHVAFYVKENIPGFVYVLGGNQSNKVCYEQYPKALVLGYRRSTDG